jgi:dynein heavy chain 1, cytosolic
VNVKYDAWHKDVLNKFGSLLGNSMRNFHADLAKSRDLLESRSIDAATTQEAVTLIANVQELKANLKAWSELKALLKDGHRTLERQRYHFSNNWLHYDNLEGEWSSFNEILERKSSSIQRQVS